MKFSKGDIISFVGTKHFTKPNGRIFFTVKPGEAKINAVMANSQHPYHLVPTKNSKSTVDGWVNEEDIVKKDARPLKVTAVSFAKSKQVKIVYAENILDDINILVSDWTPNNWTSVYRFKDGENAEKIAHAAEIARLKRQVSNAYVQKLDFVEICADVAEIPLGDKISTTSLTHSGLFYNFTSSDYINNSMYLKRGDILINNESCAIVLSNGPKSSELAKVIDTPPTEQNIKYVGKGIGKLFNTVELSVYSGPNDNFATIGTISINSDVEVLNLFADGWYRIVWVDSVDGYGYIKNIVDKYQPKQTTTNPSQTYSTQLKPEEQDINLHGNYVTITPAYVRMGPSSDENILCKLPQNTEVQNYGYYTNNGNIKWLYVQVRYKNNIYNGFISEKCLLKK